ncbi:uncharacterized protein LOC134191999 isoform X2 [Corticium candelabrum]|uniref:uncharacterized protein LOC134191999 isoform X2 n=1 Tax=Corticium candelabrum TaxID=121492 RepID=UPI002E252E87|nr:uncharacterized protein LOC134191999 isoform X2 [Corticium candelabrum]
MAVRMKDRNPDPPTPLPTDRSEDFIQDPEELFAPIPFPFSLVCKKVDIIFDRAWDEIERREKERERLAMKVLVPNYECDALAQSDAVMASERTSDETYLIVVDAKCVYVRRYDGGDVVAECLRDEEERGEENDGARTCCLSVAVCCPNCCVIAISDGQGLYIYMFYMTTLVLLRDITKQDNMDGVGRCLLSSGGDFLAVLRNNNTIEFLSLPFASWTDENTLQKLETEANELEKLSVLRSTLIKPTLILRIHPQALPPFSQFSHPSDILNSILNDINSLPTGLNHPLTQRYFKSSGTQLETPDMRLGDLHFVQSVGIPKPRAEDTVIVWWTGCHILYFYSLTHQRKDVDLNPIRTIPGAGHIASSSVSPDSRLLAIGYANGFTVVWDLFSYLAMCTVKPSAGSLTALLVIPAGKQQYNVMMGTSDGELMRIQTYEFGGGHEEIKMERDSDEARSVAGLCASACMSSLVLVVSTSNHKQLIFYDIESGQEVCELSLPKRVEVERCFLGNKQPLLYVLGRDGQLYCLSLTACSAVRPYIHGALVCDEFDPFQWMFEHRAQQLLEEDRKKYDGITQEQKDRDLKILLESLELKAKEMYEQAVEQKELQQSHSSSHNDNQSQCSSY